MRNIGKGIIARIAASRRARCLPSSMFCIMRARSPRGRRDMSQLIAQRSCQVAYRKNIEYLAFWPQVIRHLFLCSTMRASILQAEHLYKV